MNSTTAVLADAERMRCADREWLSLALMQSRNQTLAWIALFERHDSAPAEQPAQELEPAWWLAGRAGWWQERWIARNVQRVRGEAADAQRAPLASIEPNADAWWSDAAFGGRATDAPPPPFDATRAYLAETLEITLDLLRGTPESDEGGCEAWRRSNLNIVKASPTGRRLQIKALAVYPTGFIGMLFLFDNEFSEICFCRGVLPFQ